MRQETFRSGAESRCLEIEQAITALDRGKKAATESFPALYRQLCHDLAVARDRQFDASLVNRLNRLAIRGHQHLYRTRTFSLQRAAVFFRSRLPNAVRREWTMVLLSVLLLLGSMSLFALLVYRDPALTYSVVSVEQVRRVEAMYNPASDRFLNPTEQDSRAGMFGFYIMNNISISFRVFAGGILFGIGSIVVLLYNGLYLGAVAGHLVRIGYGASFFGFVSGHSALELLAIALSGVSGLKLGWSLIAPGRCTRLESVRRTARHALPLLYGSMIMLTLAAVIEAFWSWMVLPAVIEYGFAGAWWLASIAYFAFAGRKHAV